MTKRDLPQTLQGVVTPYAGNGRKLGYPTANISSETALADGVYFGVANLANFKQHPALIFIGTPTTVGDTERRVEAHLLDIPDADYYQLPIELTIQQFHRHNKTFDSVDDLLAVMRADDQAGRSWADGLRTT